MGRILHDERGFTLVELMVVVLIIGILLTLAIPAYLSLTANAYVTSCQANQRIIVTAVATSQSFNEVTTGVGSVDAVLAEGSGWGNVLIPNYIRSAPRCTAAGGGLYNMNPAGDVVSDKGAGETTFIGAGTEHDHALPEFRH